MTQTQTILAPKTKLASLIANQDQRLAHELTFDWSFDNMRSIENKNAFYFQCNYKDVSPTTITGYWENDNYFVKVTNEKYSQTFEYNQIVGTEYLYDYNRKYVIEEFENVFCVEYSAKNFCYNPLDLFLKESKATHENVYSLAKKWLQDQLKINKSLFLEK